VAPRLLATGPRTLTIGLVNAQETARRWADVWTGSWPAKDAESIVNLYAEGARYSAYPFREPDEGPQGVRSYLTRIFGEEEDIECWFGEPVAGDDRAAIEWWASWIEDGKEITLAGTTLLRFDEDGLIVDHRDYWNQHDGRRPPYPRW
jgi:hypothetical protein